MTSLHLLVYLSGNGLGRMLTLTCSADKGLTLKLSTTQVMALGNSHYRPAGKVQICIDPSITYVIIQCLRKQNLSFQWEKHCKNYKTAQIGQRNALMKEKFN